MTIKEDVLSLLPSLERPPGEALPDGASEEQIARAESVVGILFPPKLREWLSVCNGACVGPGGIVGLQQRRTIQDLSSILSLYPVWQSSGWIPVAGDGCGNYYVVDTSGRFGQGEPVLFVDVHDDMEAPAYIVASDVWHFLRFLFREELGDDRWPFSKRHVLVSDPEIERFSATLPWDA